MHRVLSLALVLALLAAGCGGDDSSGMSKKEYAKDLAAAGQTLQNALSDIVTQAGSGNSNRATGERLDRGAQALDDAADRFDAIDPPGDAKSAHDKLVAGLHELADVFRKGAAAAKRNDTRALTRTLQSLASSDGIKKITAAQQELQAKGITVSTTERSGSVGG